MMQLTKFFRWIVLSVIILALCSSSFAAGINNPRLSSRTLRSMGRVYMAYGQYDKAQNLVEQALSKAKGKKDTSELAMCNIDLGTIYRNLNLFEKAEKAYSTGIEFQKQTLYENHPYIAYSLRLLSSSLFDHGDFEKANQAIDEALSIMQDNFAYDDPIMIPFKLQKMKLTAINGDFEAARKGIYKIKEAIERKYNDQVLYTATLLKEIATCQIIIGDFENAENNIDRTLVIQEDICGEKSHLLLYSWMTKAKIYWLKGDYEESNMLIEKALKTAKKQGNKFAFNELKEDARHIRESKILTASL